MAGSPADIPLDSLITRSGQVPCLEARGLESVYPVVQGYKDFAAYGLRVNLSDPMFLNRANLTATYTPTPTSRRASATICGRVSSATT